jgi:hypothetical protein
MFQWAEIAVYNKLNDLVFVESKFLCYFGHYWTELEIKFAFWHVNIVLALYVDKAAESMEMDQ